MISIKSFGHFEFIASVSYENEKNYRLKKRNYFTHSRTHKYHEIITIFQFKLL